VSGAGFQVAGQPVVVEAGRPDLENRLVPLQIFPEHLRSLRPGSRHGGSECGPIDQRWRDMAAALNTHDRHRYGCHAVGNRLWKENVTAGQQEKNFDDLHRCDQMYQMYQLIAARRGQSDRRRLRQGTDRSGLRPGLEPRRLAQLAGLRRRRRRTIADTRIGETVNGRGNRE